MTLHQQLKRLGRRLRRLRQMHAVLRWIALTLGLWLLWFWLDNLLHLPAGIRLAMLVVGITVPLWRGWRDWLHPDCWRLSPERTARDIERQCSIRDNALINACCFERANLTGAAAAFASHSLETGLAYAGTVRPEQLRDPRAMRRAVSIALVSLLLWAIYAFVLSHHACNAFSRLLLPLADIPPVSNVRVSIMPEGTLTLWAGEPLVVTARLESVSGALKSQKVFPILRQIQPDGRSQAIVDLPMEADATHADCFVWRASSIREPFTCNVHYGDTWSHSLKVEIRHPPDIMASSFEVTSPEYTGATTTKHPGVPSPLRALTGSRVKISLRLDRTPAQLVWQQGDQSWPLTRISSDDWGLELLLKQGGDYFLRATAAEDGTIMTLARGTVALLPDQTPEVDWVDSSLNRRCWPGAELAISIEASDDYGLQALWVTATSTKAAPEKAEIVERWSYNGPPGRQGSLRERLALRLDPQRFRPGESYRFEARARDWNPAGNVALSAPLLIRMRQPEKAADDLTGTAQAAALALKQAVVEQRRSLGLTRNLEVHLGEALAKDHLDQHCKSIHKTQKEAQRHGRIAVAELQEMTSQASTARRLKLLVEQEMGQALSQIEALDMSPERAATILPRIVRLASNQTYILNELLSLLGRLAGQARLQQDLGAGSKAAPAPTDSDRAHELQTFLKDFIAVQKRIVEQSRSLLERGPEDLTEEELDILGQLAREEGQWAAMLRDKLDDLAKNPLQDFADGSLAEEFNEIWQDVQKAAESLYAKKLELAVPQEQGGLENAEELVHNLERWLTDKPDYIKWLMEEPPTLPDVPLAELPRELEDIVGDLLDEETAMTDEVEDVTSGWIDSIDKGAGWDAMDGPISSMSAKGVTGNQLPNNHEIGGRAGEGRTGRSQGQMVENAAVGKKGRQTPARLTPTPFETGAVDDQSQESPGGATGGGKLAGFAAEGLRGPSPPPRKEQMRRLAGRQTEIRQHAERLNLHLRAHGVPSGDLDVAIANMHEFERHAASGEAPGIRRAFDATLDAMRSTRAAVAAEAISRRERGAMPRKVAEELWSGLRADVPPGYEEIVAAYYRRLAGAGDLREADE